MKDKDLNKLCKQKLQGITVSRGKRDEDVARAIGISPVTYSRKINKPYNRFFDDEIAVISDYLELTAKEVLDIFFPKMFRNLTKASPKMECI